MSRLAFEFPAALYLGIPLGMVLLGVYGLRTFRRSGPRRWWAVSLLLRTATIMALILLAARPVWVEVRPASPSHSELLLLVDRSASMSLVESDVQRYQRAITFARTQLIPAANLAGLPMRAFLFAEDVDVADGAGLQATVPDGKYTDLARGVLGALASSPESPAAVVALTDGVFTRQSENAQALAALLRGNVPFLAVGIGSDVPPRTISLVTGTAPPTVPPRQPFRISVQLEIQSREPLPPFELVLLRDGKLREQRTITPVAGSRFWQESFSVVEAREGLRNYSVRMLVPELPGLRCLRSHWSTRVRVGRQKDLPILFLQGALTWDYKFIRLALQGDPAMKLTGVTQTTEQSILHQVVGDRERASQGFPATFDELSEYRAVVISNFRAEQLSDDQQKLLERFCAELGGGILVMGGPDTLDAAWNATTLGRMLPVRIKQVPASLSSQPVRLELTPEALAHPVFRLTDTDRQQAAWSSLPTFTHAAVMSGLKPGAQSWALAGRSRGADGRSTIVMAQQRFGAGVVIAMGVQTFWRWRLGRDSDPESFDRFWRQLLRFLADAGRQELRIVVPDQELAPHVPIKFTVERPPDAAEESVATEYQVHVEDGRHQRVHEALVELAPGKQATVEFRPARSGLHQVSVTFDSQPLAYRMIEIRDGNRELQEPARNMEALRHWAAVTGGLALPIEDCRDASILTAAIEQHARSLASNPTQARSRPAGASGWVWAGLLGLICAEWSLRKFWNWL